MERFGVLTWKTSSKDSKVGTLNWEPGSKFFGTKSAHPGVDGWMDGGWLDGWINKRMDG